ncbi:MAG TPA: fumarylacetoacetate hydrolase family protein [Acetobacteraceae bacterium]|jgi:2-keto-4-pentenoate hydratase|nr:fumarylacetoacetate hydrolase family protein [Acetobacteraceae bacterium]
MSAEADSLAELLLAARQAHQKLDTLPENLRPADEAAAIAVQRVLAERLDALPPAGFKIGATAKHMQAYLDVDGPIAGFIAKPGLHASGIRLRFADFQSPGVECELVARLGADLPAGPCDAARAAAAVEAVSAGIEIVENRYPDISEFGTNALIADQVCHAAAVTGAAQTEWRALDLKGIEGTLLVNQGERGHGKGAELLGDPMAALAWLASSPLAAAFGGLKAGQVVMLGSVTPTVWLLGPAKVEVLFPPLGTVFLTLE